MLQLASSETLLTLRCVRIYPMLCCLCVPVHNNAQHLSVVRQELMQHKLVFIETTDVVETTLALDNFRRACDCGRGAVFFSVARGKVAEVRLRSALMSVAYSKRDMRGVAFLPCGARHRQDIAQNTGGSAPMWLSLPRMIFLTCFPGVPPR